MPNYDPDWINDAGEKFESLKLIQLPNGQTNDYMQLEIPLSAPEQADKAKVAY